jgi:hypothetical protein
MKIALTFTILMLLSLVVFFAEYRPAYFVERAALEIGCPLNHNQTSEMRTDCAIYSATGYVRKDFK